MFNCFNFYQGLITITIIMLHGIGFGQVPACSQLSLPTDGDSAVSVNTKLEWGVAIGATGYIINVGTFSGGNDILDQKNLGNVTIYNSDTNLPPESDIYVTIFPYNDDGVNTSCAELHFVTGETTIPGCTEIINPRDGAVLIPVNQNITWIRDFSATGYLMTVAERDLAGVLILDNEPVGNGTNFKPPNFKPRTLYFVTITPFNEAGAAENCQTISFITGDPLPLPKCAEVVFPKNQSIEVPVDTTIEWNPVSGVEGYLLSLGTAPAGTDILNSQDVGAATTYELPQNLPMGTRIYVKIASYKNGEMSSSCPLSFFETKGVDRVDVQEFIPKFFTPNNDGQNDVWKIDPLENVSIVQILVYDRYGMLLKQMEASQGWDGTFNGKRLPSGSYWYAVEMNDATRIRGFFLLKR